MIDFDGFERALTALEGCAQRLLDLNYIRFNKNFDYPYLLCRTGHSADDTTFYAGFGWCDGRLTFKPPIVTLTNHEQAAALSNKTKMGATKAEILSHVDQIGLILRAHPAFNHKHFQCMVAIAPRSKSTPRISIVVDDLTCSNKHLLLPSLMKKLRKVINRLGRFPATGPWLTYAVTQAAIPVEAPSPAAAYIKWAAFQNPNAFDPEKFKLDMRLGILPLVRQCLPFDSVLDDIKSMMVPADA